MLLTDLLLMAYLDSSLIKHRTSSLGITPNRPPSDTNKMPYSEILRRHFLNQVFLLSDNSNLCLVDIRLTSIHSKTINLENMNPKKKQVIHK